MRHCAPHEDNLALLAGGDLASAGEELALREHLAACEGCLELFVDLQGDLLALRDLPELAAEEDGSLCADVLKRLATTESPVRRKIGQHQHLSAAATVMIVMTALAVAFSLQDLPNPADGGVNLPSIEEGVSVAKEPIEGLPVRLYRAGGSLELAWSGDGREAVSEGPALTYRVLASALPNDFVGGRAVEVAGQRLVTSDMLFPARRMGDRDLTFFRVE